MMNASLSCELTCKTLNLILKSGQDSAEVHHSNTGHKRQVISTQHKTSSRNTMFVIFPDLTTCLLTVFPFDRVCVAAFQDFWQHSPG